MLRPQLYRAVQGSAPPIPARYALRGSLVHAVLCRGTYMALRLSVSAVGTNYNSGALIPKCNGLSQFRDDIGEPFVPVREFNLIACPLVQSR